MLNRRSFFGRSAIALAVLPFGSAMVFSTTGCNTSWIQTAINDVPVAISIAQSISAIVTLATGQAIITPIIADGIQTAANVVTAGLKTLQDAINAYNTSKSSTGLAKVIDSLNQTLSDLPNILPTLTFTDQATKVAITTGVTLLISTLSAIQVLIPSPVAATATRKVNGRLAAAHSALATSVEVPSAKQVKGQYNSVLWLNGYGQLAIN